MASLLTTWKFQGCNRLFAEFVAAKPEGRKTALGEFSIVLNLNHSKIGLKDWFIGTIPLTIVLAPMHSVGLEMVRDAFKAPRLGRKKTYIAGQSLLDDSTPVLKLSPSASVTGGQVQIRWAVFALHWESFPCTKMGRDDKHYTSASNTVKWR